MSRPGPAMHLVELEPQGALSALAAGEVDLAIVHSYSKVPELPSPALAATHLITEDVLLAVSGEHSDGGPPVDLAEFAHCPGARWRALLLLQRRPNRG